MEFPKSLDTEKNPQIGARVLFLRRERKWRQGELAKRAGVNVDTIVRLEKGRQVGVPIVERVAGVLGVTLEYLYTPLD